MWTSAYWTASYWTGDYWPPGVDIGAGGTRRIPRRADLRRRIIAHNNRIAMLIALAESEC